MSKRISHVIGFDDAPFDRRHRGDVLLIGTVFANHRLEAVLSAKIRRDGINATDVITTMIKDSRFSPHLQAILLQGISFAGFNVVDIQRLYDNLDIPVLVISRKRPNLSAIRTALLEHVRGGRKKWQLIEKAGVMEAVGNVFVQRVGISLGSTERLIKKLAVNSTLPEPLRTAHLIAGGIVTGESKHRP